MQVRSTPSLTTSERALLRKPVADRIRYARKKAGLTQEQLANAIGTDRLHVLRWEGREYLPRLRYRVALAEATGFPAEFFAKHEGRGGK